MDRIDTLLTKTVEHLLAGCAPLSHTFLVDNNVTLTEALQLAQLMANIIKGYVTSPLQERATLLLCSQLDEIKIELPDMTPALVWDGYVEAKLHERMREFTAKSQKVRQGII